MSGTSITLSLARPATHLPVEPGTTITVRGSLVSSHDGTVLTADSTSYPADAPGGASVAAGGLVDFAAGGFHVVARDPATGVVKAVATADDAPVCEALGVSEPCLPLRTRTLAHARLLTEHDFVASLRGELRAELPGSSTGVLTTAAYDDAGDAVGVARGLPPLAIVVLLAIVMALVGWLLTRRLFGSARRRLTRLLRQIDRTARSADPVLSQVLRPALGATERAVRRRRLDPASTVGRQLEQALQALHSELCEQVVRDRCEAERRVADALVAELAVALAAAAEARCAFPETPSHAHCPSP
jgi:hypothetical protein